jgi:hypothetical protein
MMKLIDKDALVAEIEKRVNEYPCDNSEQDIGYHCALYEMGDFLNSLKVKDVDLEEEVDLLIKSSTWAMANREDFLRVAKHFFELGLKSQKGE